MQVRDQLRDMEVGPVGFLRMESLYANLSLLVVLSIHFDEYLVLCGYSHYISGQLVSFVDHCIFGLWSH